MKRKNYINVLFVGVLAFFTLTAFNKDYFEVSKQLEIFATLFKELNIYYVDDTKPDELMDEAINSMLGTLDPYTTYLDEDESEDFQIHTSGEYAGIGAAIREIDNKIVVVQSYKGHSADRAGIIPGDVIVQIDDNKIIDADSDIAVSALKGSIGSEVSVKIKRSGIDDLIDIKLVREKINVKSVPYYSMIDDEIGYVSLTAFTRKSSHEVEYALEELKLQGMKYLIFDLRGNPGGLLSQAVHTVNLFVNKGTLVVETKGRIEDWNRKYYTKNKAKYEKLPLVVLTDYGSASASEIVAGALQDLDRAIVMGERTYGKGLVQQPRALSYGTHLKITIAKYYIPSGRCIQAKDYFNKNDDGSAKTVPDSLRSIFKTKNGRIVYDGAGIEPDIKIEEKEISDFTSELIMSNYVFNYSTQYALKHKGDIDLSTFHFSDKEFNDFKKYIATSNFQYQSKTDKELEKLIEKAKNENLYTEIKPSLDKLKSDINKENVKQIDKNKSQIIDYLEQYIVTNNHYEEGLFEFNTINDELIKEAKLVLKDKEDYYARLSVK